MAAYYRAMQQSAPNVLDVFYDDLLATACCIETLEEAATFLRNDCVTDPAAVDLFDTLLVSLSNNKRKSAYSESDGKRASTYRKRIVQRALTLVRTGEQYQKIPSKRATHSSLPVLLKKCQAGTDVILESHIATARLKVEQASNGSSAYHRRAEIGLRAKPLRSDVAEYVVHTVYDSVLEQLNTSRKQLPVEFTKMVRYLFLDWHLYPDVRVNSESVRFLWQVDARARTVMPMGSTPRSSL